MNALLAGHTLYARSVLLGLGMLAPPARAQATGTVPPSPPCAKEAPATYPSIGEEPAITFWRASDVPKGWVLPACADPAGKPFLSLVTTVGRFPFGGTSDELLQRIGAISALKGMNYWSASHAKWQTLIVDASALSTDKRGDRRADFTTAELRPGASVYFEQADNLMGNAVYHLHVGEVSADRLVFDVENAASIKYTILTLYHPGEMRIVYFFERESPGVWRFYSMLRTGERASSLTSSKPHSSINRSLAFYRHYAGIPTDKDPPAARK